MTLPPPCVPRAPRRCTPLLCVPLAKRALSGALGSPLCPSSQGDSSPRDRPARGRVTPSAGGAPGRGAATVPPQARGGGAEAATAVGLLGVRTPSLGTWLALLPTFPARPRAPPHQGRRGTGQSAPGLRDVTASRRLSPGLQPWVSCHLAAAWSAAGEAVTVQGGLEGIVHRIRAKIAQVWRENRVMFQRQWGRSMLVQFSGDFGLSKNILFTLHER